MSHLPSLHLAMTATRGRCHRNHNLKKGGITFNIRERWSGERRLRHRNRKITWHGIYEITQLIGGEKTDKWELKQENWLSTLWRVMGKAFTKVLQSPWWKHSVTMSHGTPSDPFDKKHFGIPESRDYKNQSHFCFNMPLAWHHCMNLCQSMSVNLHSSGDWSYHKPKNKKLPFNKSHITMSP